MPIDGIEECINSKSGELSLQYSGEDAADVVVEVAEAIRNGRLSQHITTLDLGGNGFNKDHVEPLIDLVLPHMTTLTELDFRHNDLETEGVVILRPALEKHCRNLLSIDVSENRVRDAGAREIAGLLLALPKMTSIKLGSNQLTPKCVPSLLAGLKSATALTYLGLEFNGLGDIGTVELLKGMRGKCLTLRTLNLSDSCIGDDGVINGIAPFISAGPSEQRVAHIDLSVNKIGVKGALAFAAAMKKARSLVSIDLGCNPITERGGLEIAKALGAATCHVASIDLTATEMTPAVVERLRASILANSRVYRVRTGSNDNVPEELHRMLFDLVADRREPNSDADDEVSRGGRGSLPFITAMGPDLNVVAMAVSGALLVLVA